MIKLTRILMASTLDDHARTNPQQSAVLTRYDHFDAFKVTAKCLYTKVTFSLLFITFTLSARREIIRTCIRSLRLSTQIYYICLWLASRTSYHSHTINYTTILKIENLTFYIADLECLVSGSMINRNLYQISWISNRTIFSIFTISTKDDT